MASAQVRTGAASENRSCYMQTMTSVPPLRNVTINVLVLNLYISEFNVISTYNNSGECPGGTIKDDDTCMKVEMKIFDNCPQGTHLIENICCKEGLRFIRDGKCSRYSDIVETVICPSGTYEVGKGRCCPNGTELIDDKCQKP